MVWVRAQVPARALFYHLCFLGWGVVLLRSAARRACVLLSCRVWCVFPGWRAWWVGWRFGRLLRIFLTRCAIWYCCSLWLLAPSGSLCGVLGGVETLVRALGCLRCESPRGARTARFSWVFGARVAVQGEARVRVWCGVRERGRKLFLTGTMRLWARSHASLVICRRLG